MDSIYELIGRLQVTYWTILRRSFKKKSLLYKTAYSRAEPYGFVLFNQQFPRKKSTGIFQDTKHDINSHYQTNLNAIYFHMLAPARHPGISHVVIFVFCRIKMASSELYPEEYRYCVKHYVGTFSLSKSVKLFKTASALLPDCFSF